MSITLVAGLGNPGQKYAKTRHNIGFLVIDALARQLGLSWRNETAFEAEIARWDFSPGKTRLLIKPQTFMNESGRALRKLAGYYKVHPDDIVVVYDDLTIDLGGLKISVKGSPGGHNGVASLLTHLNERFVRYRIGIGPKLPREMDLKDFVLGNFTPEQQQGIDQNIERYVTGLRYLLDQGSDKAMNLLNRRSQNESDQTQLPRDLHP